MQICGTGSACNGGRLLIVKPTYEGLIMYVITQVCCYFITSAKEGMFSSSLPACLSVCQSVKVTDKLLVFELFGTKFGSVKGNSPRMN